MSDKYHIRLSDAQRKLFEAWSRQFPAGDWEKRWAKEVEAVEGYINPYIQ